ncbi:PREDICTED: ankyrin repeat and zinc finger domain-containing protein 1-like [Papilio xuthus]|uniref:Ankyrin repeat and zinc finger domain-containing protein 1-like n=1 Tax=Papilio xuthus TaxID=66420 RepID=A0AAJ6ZDN8_PAPXU|nr:PREDICTED: ankyrin repeat and zinc finger domain-containing protein 1-like [Papilio xuthus]
MFRKMANKTEVAKPHLVRVYELDAFERLLRGIRVPACMITESHVVVDEQSVLKRLNALTIGGPADGNCCSCCGVGPFTTRAKQTAHYKEHWHTYNIKRKLFGKPALTLGQFNSRQDDNSSVSGSDSEGDDGGTNPASDLFAAATRHCKAFFTNRYGQVFCVYRCILHHKKEELSTDGDGQNWVERCTRLSIPGYQRWAVLMVSGGHFAGAIFSGGVVVLHKTHHSYVTRRGQGQAQYNRDHHGNAPRSAGASLRRYNQAQFLEHVQEIIASWAEDLKGCSCILYRAVGSMNQAALFGKNSPLSRDDFRVRALPFPTKKPSFKEVKRVHETLASFEVYDSMEIFQKALIASSTKPAKQTGSDESKKVQKSPSKTINRAKSRERPARELPTQLISSEDEGPCFIDLDTPLDWIKTLSEQSRLGLLTNSRKDLINDTAIASCRSSESQDDNLPEHKEQIRKKKNKKKAEEGRPTKKGQPKIPASVQKMWTLIEDNDFTSLETIIETWEGDDLEAACNTQDPSDGNTALHKAAIAAKGEMVTQILTSGGDPCVKNHLLQTPYAASQDSDIRVLFRLFQGQYPDKYNYNKSQIPGPVTLEQLEQEKEKKAQQKKLKRQRNKVKQVEKIKTNKYLQLTDTQKVRLDEPRCFLCAHRLPKPPFEYDKYKFCSIRCLQNHRNVRPLHMSA